MACVSSGAIAVGWAAALADSYAPELNLVGAAHGGTPADLKALALNLVIISARLEDHKLTLILRTAAWVPDVNPGLLSSLARALRG